MRQTLSVPTAPLEGIGLHSGAAVWMQAFPAPSGSGIVLADAASGQEIGACAANVADTSRCTRLADGKASVATVEHLLSALAGLGIDDVRVETRGGELPAGDGSAAPFVSLLRTAGICAQADGEPIQPLVVTRPRLLSGENGAILFVSPAASFRATVVLDFPDYPFLGTQMFRWDASTDDYAVMVAPARTFGFLGELAYLRARGLALGASYDNAIVMDEAGYRSDLRFPEELARHKLLDLIGDLALAGRPMQADVLAIKPSHTLNTRLAACLASEPEAA